MLMELMHMFGYIMACQEWASLVSDQVCYALPVTRCMQRYHACAIRHEVTCSIVNASKCIASIHELRCKKNVHLYLSAAHLRLSFGVCAPLARVAQHYWLCRGLSMSLQKKREYLAAELEQIGFRILPSSGTYFLVADFRHVPYLSSVQCIAACKIDARELAWLELINYRCSSQLRVRLTGCKCPPASGALSIVG